jgi:uncharacterized protein
MDAVRVPPLPMDLRWLSRPLDFEQAGGVLRIIAGPGTDWFVDPGGRPPSHDAPALAGPQTGPFRLSARVTVTFGATFDAGGLVVYADAGRWAKLCLERSPEGEATVVSVVTRGLSDDCTSESVEGDSLWLRVSRLDSHFVFHVSRDGRRWRFVRHFALEAGDEPLIGFEAQCPTGDLCAVTFDDVAFGTDPPTALRDGT